MRRDLLDSDATDFSTVGVHFRACTHDSVVAQMERWVEEGRAAHYV